MKIKMHLVPLNGTPDRLPPINLKNKIKSMKIKNETHPKASYIFYYCLLCFSDLSNFSVFGKLTVCKGGHAVAQLVEALRYKPEGRGVIGIFY
jgi:hypothetical protein